MSELLGGDESLLSLWTDHFLTKPAGLDWSLKDQQIIPVPIVILDDGRIAFRSDNGQICLLDGLTGGEETNLSLPPEPPVELPSLSDAAIKSMLVQDALDPELPLVGSDMSELADKDLPDDDLKALVSFRCQYCDFSSADVPSLMHHSETEHAELQSEVLREQDEILDEINETTLSSDVPEKMEAVEPVEPAEDLEVKDVVEQFVYVCSECKEGFDTVTQCRDHMIKDHNMVFDSVQEKEEQTTNDIETEVVPEVSAPPPASPPPTVPVAAFRVLRLPIPRTKECDPEYEAKPYKCPDCVHKFRTAGGLEQHMQCHSQDDSRTFTCPTCSSVFANWGRCAQHLWKEHKIDIDLYTCKVCQEYKTTTRKKLECHSRIHSEERPYKCSECGKGFKQRTQLINHTASVHKKDQCSTPKWYMSQKCEICLKTYADSKSLKKHLQAVHSKLKPYKCQICGHMSARKAMLQAHVRQHTGEKPFACEMCTFRTGDHNSLRRHKMQHTGTKPYRCPHCPYSSIQSSSFKSHLRSRHPGQSGMYTCGKCYFATVSEQSYREHMSDHRLNLIPPNEEEMFPENVAAAHLVYRSFGASPSRLHSDVTASLTSRDRMKQTITISIPSRESAVTDDEDTTHGYLPGDDDLDTGGITIPAEPECQLICFN